MASGADGAGGGVAVRMRVWLAGWACWVLLSVLPSVAGETVSGVPPLYSHVTGGEVERLDVLWPLYSKRVSEQEISSRVLWFWFDRADRGGAWERSWLLPFWFAGRTEEGRTYRALFPVGGTLENFLLYDRVSFVLWPLYAKTEVNELIGRSIGWPFYERVEGPGIERVRFFPFYGRSVKEGIEENRFVMWPIYSSVRALSERGGSGFVLFPFYGQIDAPHLQSRWVLPPFFRFSRSEDQVTRYLPWPVVQWADGAVEKRYFWPVVGRKVVGRDRSGFAVWPVVKWEASGDEEQGWRRWQVVPFYRQRTEWDAGRAERSAEWKLWPLARGERSGTDRRLEVLALWPFERSEVIERNWAACWKLFRWERDESRMEWSLLHGVLGYKREGMNRSWKLFFMSTGEERAVSAD